MKVNLIELSDVRLAFMFFFALSLSLSFPLSLSFLAGSRPYLSHVCSLQALVAMILTVKVVRAFVE